MCQPVRQPFEVGSHRKGLRNGSGTPNAWDRVQAVQGEEERRKEKEKLALEKPSLRSLLDPGTHDALVCGVGKP